MRNRLYQTMVSQEGDQSDPSYRGGAGVWAGPDPDGMRSSKGLVQDKRKLGGVRYAQE
jgi:hypothetical protein